ncbi:hypothetical protein RJ639_033222 [Escallonia herrerae]|uniref:Cytochrome c oxidase assembly protein n=1 Tax=Escallonia herrerae TaxID=1293975 RepID=A0AA88WSK3_9ASTE|nr:hypothetical protein RJ639_033222 [Escallonia herrerae]
MLESRLISILRRNKSLNPILSSSPSHANLIGSCSFRVLKEASLRNPSRFFSSSSVAKLIRPCINGTSAARNLIIHGFRSSHHHHYKDFYKPSFRSLSTTAASACKDNEGLKLLVTAGPHAQKMVGIWLFASAAWVFSMVVLGGVTRLTRSGLSMTDWKFTGSLPPLSDEDWLIEFEKYKRSPEYNRALGLMFALPFSYFLRKGYITLRLGVRLSGLFALGAGQGLIGWWMVKSGLEEPASEFAQPRVSPYRLAAHLTSAFVIYCGLFWTALSVVMPEPPTESVTWVRGAARVKRLALPVSIVVGITAISGAFVAGNDALDHRILATATLASIGGLWLATRKLDIHPAVRSLIGSTLGMAALQVTLGISTLLSYVPVSLGSAHQAGALTLLTLMILLNHTVRRPSISLLKSLLVNFFYSEKYDICP